jgi:hypothetical protein
LAFHSGSEADHSPPSSAEIKEWVELYLHSPKTPSWRGAQWGGAQGQLYFFCCLIMTLSSVCYKASKWRMTINDEVESGRPVLKYCPRTCLQVLTKIARNLRIYTHPPGRNTNHELLEYEAGVPTTEKRLHEISLRFWTGT